MIIYKTTNLVNGKIYIGQDSKNNPKYLGSGTILKKAIKKYGKDNFIKEIIDECTTIDELNRKEVYWIDKLDSTIRDIGYNISYGGEEGDRKLGHEIAKEGIYNYWVRIYGKDEANKKLTKKKDKLRKLNKHSDLVTKGKYNIWLEKYGEDEANKKYNEWKLKISQYQQKKILSGWTHTDETKKKISESSKGRKHSDETKRKISILKKGRKKTKEHKEAISKSKIGVPTNNNKLILQYDQNNNLIKEWRTQNDAELTLKIHNIVKVLKGKQRTAGGFIWKYK